MPKGTAKPADKVILVVDDEPDVLRYQGAILEDAGFTVVTASSGEDALEAVKRRAPDLVSLDLVMPGKSGMRFLHALRRNREWATIPVIIVTGHAHDDLGRGPLDDIRSGGMITGPQVCLDKPVRPETYVAAVMERLGLAGESGGGAMATTIRGRIDSLLDDADTPTLREIHRLLEGRGKTRPPKPEGPSVLVIDDEPDAAAYIAAILEDEGYAATSVTDPFQAIDKAREVRPVLVTLDVNMPRKNGIEVYRELKEDPELRDAAVIVISAFEEEWEERFRAQPGLPPVEGFLRKPIEPAALLHMAEKLLA